MGQSGAALDDIGDTAEWGARVFCADDAATVVV